jgi:hypothetical protein
MDDKKKNKKKIKLNHVGAKKDLNPSDWFP